MINIGNNNKIKNCYVGTDTIDLIDKMMDNIAEDVSLGLVDETRGQIEIETLQTLRKEICGEFNKGKVKPNIN